MAQPQEEWLKGSTHVHARPSGDSSTPIADVVKWYEDRSYDFIVLTDHNQISELSKDATPTVGSVAISDPASRFIVLAGIELTHNPSNCIPPGDKSGKCRIHVNLLGVTDRVTIFRAQPDAHVETGPLIRHLWQLDVVAARYRALAAHYRPLTRRRTMSDKDAFVSCTEMMHAFRAFSTIDPELNEAWIPHAGARRQAIEIFELALDRLKPAATLHFEELTRAPAYHRGGLRVRRMADVDLGVAGIDLSTRKSVKAA